MLPFYNVPAMETDGAEPGINVDGYEGMNDVLCSNDIILDDMKVYKIYLC